MTAPEQLAALRERLVGLIGAALSHPTVDLTKGNAEKDRVEGQYILKLLGRAGALADDYEAFLREQVAAARPMASQSKPPELNGKPIQAPAAAVSPKPASAPASTAQPGRK